MDPRSSARRSKRCRLVAAASIGVSIAVAISGYASWLSNAFGAAAVTAGVAVLVMSHRRLRELAPVLIDTELNFSSRPMTGWELARATRLPAMFVYPALDQMMERGAVADSWSDESGQPGVCRRFYRLAYKPTPTNHDGRAS
jgi:hypothetical protein